MRIIRSKIDHNISLQKVDEVGDKYYKNLSIYTWIERILFYLCASLSLIIYYSPPKFTPYHDCILSFYLVCSLAIFAISHLYKLYLFPRAEEKRSKNFYGTAYNVTLGQENTNLYYNNNFKNSQLKLALQLMENAFFTKSITSKMVIFQRLITFTYFTIWILMLSYRDIPIDFMIIFSQILFCEFIFSKTLRLELLNNQVDKIYDELLVFICNNNKIDNYFSAKIANFITHYEVIKAIAAISLSTFIFNYKCHDLKNDWIKICGKIEKYYPSYI